MLAWKEKIVSLQRRNGRAVECGGLENRCTAMYRGFESLFLRGTEVTNKSLLFFIHETSRNLTNKFTNCFFVHEITLNLTND